MRVKFIQKHNGTYHTIAEGEMTKWHSKHETIIGDMIGRESVITSQGIRISLTRKEYATILDTKIINDGKEDVCIYELGAFVEEI